MKKSYIDAIKKASEAIISKYSFSDEPVRDNIFKILRDKGVVIFYPMEEEEDLDGFHVDRTVNGEKTAFVYINTAKYFDKCIFCAAHELGHICEIEKIIESDIGETVPGDQVDDIMNRFAAELLMPEKMFISRLKSFLLNGLKVTFFFQSKVFWI